MKLPVAFTATILLDLVGSLVDVTRLAKILGDLVLVESGLGLRVVVGNVIALVGTGHDVRRKGLGKWR